MKFKIEDLDSLSDSKEIIESKPHVFTSIFIYLLLTIIITFFIWACFFEKEIVINASGIVRPADEPYCVSNMVLGTIKKIHVKDGQSIKKGDLLVELENKDLKLQLKSIKNKIHNLESDNLKLKKLIKSIDSHENFFQDNEDEKEFYYKYKLYSLENKNSQTEIDSLSKSKKDLESKIDNLSILKQCIDMDKNLTSDDSYTKEQFKVYQSNKEILENRLSELTNSKNPLDNESDSQDAQQSKTNPEIDSIKNQLNLLKNESNIKIQSSIDELNSQLNTINSNLEKLDESHNLAKEKNDISYLSQIQSSIESNKNKIEELKFNESQIAINIDRCLIKSQINGKVDLNQNLELGLLLKPGESIANILPSTPANKIDLVIQNKDIGNLKEGQNIKYSFESLPYKEYGFGRGNLKSIGIDSKVENKSKNSFFTAEGSLDSNILKSHKHETSKIKPGMTCTAKIITRKEKMIYYLLEKIDFQLN